MNLTCWAWGMFWWSEKAGAIIWITQVNFDNNIRLDLKFLFSYSWIRVTGSSLSHLFYKERVKMYHAHFRGTHYEAGFRWGSLRRNGLTTRYPVFPSRSNITVKLQKKSRGLQMDNIAMSIFYRQSCLVCTPFRQRVTVPVLDSLQGRKSCWDGTVIFWQKWKN